jgi:hypothetical protein
VILAKCAATVAESRNCQIGHEAEKQLPQYSISQFYSGTLLLLDPGSMLQLLLDRETPRVRDAADEQQSGQNPRRPSRPRSWIDSTAAQATPRRARVQDAGGGGCPLGRFVRAA